MARYYFDIHDGSQCHKDTEGSDLLDNAAARTIAMHVLPNMARDHRTPDNERRDFIVDVRDAEGRVIYIACLCLFGRSFD